MIQKSLVRLCNLVVVLRKGRMFTKKPSHWVGTFLVFLSLTAVCLQGCTRKPAANAPKPAKGIASAQPAQRPSSPPVFTDVGEQAGLHYQWKILGKRPLNILQSIGNGCAFLDYDNDGNLDILLVGLHPVLYRGDGRGHFSDVTHQTGLDKISGHFLGCAVGDYDNDGFDDIYLSANDGGELLHNEHGKRFLKVTQQAGLVAQPWGTSCTFVDIDGDGKLDLYIGNYVRFGPTTQPQLCGSLPILTGCGPGSYQAERGVLYHNKGGGKFQNVTQPWGFGSVSGRALGVAAAPVDSVGHIALALANDQSPGDLMVTRGKVVKNEGVSSGMAYAAAGQVYAGMGIDWGDYDNDGSLDLAIAAYQNQAKGVYHNENGLFVMQDTARLGMFSSVPYVTFGLKWLDYDNDGWLDLMFANGHVQDNIAQSDFMNDAAHGAVYRQPIVLYHSLQGKRFEDERSRLGGDAQKSIVGRGLAVGDYDNDGRIDALVVDSEGKPLLLHNVTPGVGHWLMIQLVGSKSNRNGYGAVLTAEAGGRKIMRHCHADGSYLSSSDKRVHFGLGATSKIDRLQVRWPDGHVDSYRSLTSDQIVTVYEGRSTIQKAH